MIQNIKTLLSVAAVAVCCTLTACGCSSSSSDNPEPTPEPEPEPPIELEGKAVIYVTTDSRSYDFEKLTAEISDKPSMSPRRITLDPTTRYQEIDGFGAAITGSTCYNLMQMTQENRTKFLKETFSVSEGMGQSYVRISIGASDFSLSEYTCCDMPGIENFALQSEELDYVIPIMKEILAINPNVKVMGSPWSAPRWMKVNNLTSLDPYNSWTSGHLNPNYYEAYGEYFQKWILAMESHGIKIYSITPQNEPLNRGNSMSMYMGWEEQLNFIKVGLGPALKEAGLKTKVYLFDHNYNYDNIANEQQYPLKIYEDAEAAKYVTGAAYHNYGGDKSELGTIHNAAPEMELVFTETSIGTWNDGHNLGKRLIDDMKEFGLGTVDRWCKGVIVWNLMLDDERGPNRPGGCVTCYGAVDINKSDYATITRNSHYYVVGHLSAVAKPGAVRIGASKLNVSGVQYTAFENTDGTYGLVLLNESSDKLGINITAGEKNFTFEVPARSVVSYGWEK